MRFYSMTTNRAAIDSLSFHDAVTIGGGIHEIRLRFGKAAPAFWKIWKAIETGTQEDQKAAYNSLSALLFGEDAAGIAAAEGEAVFFVWLYHYTQTRVLPFMLACSAALKFAYMRATCLHPPAHDPGLLFCVSAVAHGRRNRKSPEIPVKGGRTMHIIEHKDRAAAKPYKDTVIFKRGGQKLRLRVHADPFAALCQMDAALDTMRKAESKIKANPADAEVQEAYGGAVLDFFAAVFGEDQTLAIVDFYKGLPGFMLRDVKRYIIGTALPKIKKLAAKQSRRA